MLRYFSLIGFIFLFVQDLLAQPSNDDCSNAIQLCAGQSVQATTAGATNNGTEDNAFCGSTSATIWFTFTTNSTGGFVNVDFTNLNFNTDPSYGQSITAVIFDVGTPCDQTTYVPNSNCTTSSTDFSETSVIALNANTTYYVMVSGTNTGPGVTNAAECDFDVTVSGTGVSASNPIASFSTIDTLLCQGEGDTVQTFVSACSGTPIYEWYYNDTLIHTGSTNDFNTNTLTNSGWLKLVYSCQLACVYSDTTDSIFFHVTPIGADAGTAKYIEEGDVVVLDGTGVGNPVWSPANTLTDPTTFTPTASPSQDTEYFLEVTNDSCTATSSVWVYVGSLITIYTGFTPNDDNINDKWRIVNSDSYPDMEVTVYDRSGQKVFNTVGYSDPDKWWDGTYKGKPLPVSTYFYVVDLKIGDEGIYKGPVNILR